MHSQSHNTHRLQVQSGGARDLANALITESGALRVGEERERERTPGVYINIKAKMATKQTTFLPQFKPLELPPQVPLSILYRSID